MAKNCKTCGSFKVSCAGYDRGIYTGCDLWKEKYRVAETNKGKVTDTILFRGDLQDCEAFIRTMPLEQKNKLIKEDKYICIVTPEGRTI